MRNLFPGYYRPTDDQFTQMWETGLFVLDANVLLHLYDYNEETRSELFNIFSRVEDRLWIPHQVALEYHNNYSKVLRRQKEVYGQVSRSLKKIREEAKAALNPLHASRFVDIDQVVERIEGLFDGISGELEESERAHLEAFIGEDTVRERIICSGRVGLDTF